MRNLTGLSITAVILVSAMTLGLLPPQWTAICIIASALCYGLFITRKESHDGTL
jgi:hypothetical protein